MPESIFTGSFFQLFHYWQDETRVKKFLQGGSREKMVDFVLQKTFSLFTNANWLDIGAGPGFIQRKNLNKRIRLCVVLDISLSALLIHSNQYSQKVAGSFLNLPFRKLGFNCLTSFFCLSDYPGIKSIIVTFQPLLEIKGKLLLVDYAKDDEYWETRTLNHGKNGLVGNINLRDEQLFRKIVEPESSFRLIYAETQKFQTNSRKLEMPSFRLPKLIKRCFFQVLYQKTT